MAQTREVVSIDHYAIFETGGKQYQALEGKTVGIEKLDLQEGASVTFDKVLLRKTSAGLEVGRPYLSTPIRASIVKHLRGPKLIIFKFKRRKKAMRKQGHRQAITVVRIEAI